MTIGVACATLPTSSSFCIIFFIRAYRCMISLGKDMEDILAGRCSNGTLVCSALDTNIVSRGIMH